MIKEFIYNDLYENGADIENFETDVTEMVEDLKDTINATNREYVCANEIGYNSKAFCMKINGEPCVFFNPSFKVMTDNKFIPEVDYETGKEYLVPRCTKVGVFYQDAKKNIFYNDFEGQIAIIFNRAVDCLLGSHVKYYGLEIDDDFKNATEEEQLEVVKMYINELAKLNTQLDTELKEDPETKEAWGVYQFNRAAARGEIEFDQPEEVKPNRRMRRLLAKQARAALKKVR